MGVTRERTVTALPPAAALDLWLDTVRWPTFVDGLARIERRHERWPEPGSSVVWQSRPGGRGTVTLKVLELEPPSRAVVQVFDDKLGGRETVVVEPDERGSRIEVALEYELNQGGAFMALADWVWIRRALRDSIRRTLQRFAIEAAEDAALASNG